MFLDDPSFFLDDVKNNDYNQLKTFLKNVILGK